MKKVEKSILHKYFYDVKISGKFLLVITILLLMEIFIVNNYIRKNASALLTREIQTTSRQFLEQYMDNINFRLSRFDTLLNSFCSSSRIKQLFSSAQASSEIYENIEQEIRNILNDQFPYALYDLTFYPVTDDFPVRSGSFIKEPSPDTLQWLIQKSNDYPSRFFLNIEEPFHIRLLTAVRPLYSPDGRKIVCYIKLSLFPEKVFHFIKGAKSGYAHELFIIDSQGNYVYGTHDPEPAAYLEFVKKNYTPIYVGAPVEDYSVSSGLYITGNTSSHGYRGVYFFPYEDMMNTIQPLNRTLTISILFILFMMCILGATLSVSLNKRFGIIMKKIEQFRNRDMNIADAQAGKDEICVFDQNFTQMIREVNQLINDRYISEMQKKDAELLALQAQINPHFLFNSLEIINSLIEISQYDTACEANSRLSTLLRYSINHNSSGVVTLAEEINYMTDYVFMQKLRFREYFTFETDIDSSCLHFHILKLVFQPIIENSMKYGFTGTAFPGKIKFTLQDEGGHLRITISDNGNGMSQEEYAELMHELDSASFHDLQSRHDSIGILNIHCRLKLKYGDEYSMQIKTGPGTGMSTSIIIPKT